MLAVTAFLMLTGMLAIAAVTDARGGVIPNWLTYTGMLAGLAFWLGAGLWTEGLAGGWDLGGTALLACLAGLVPGMALFFLGGLGGGDAKLLGAVGAVSGQWECVFVTAVYALLLALGMAVVVMVRRRIVWQTLGRMMGVALALVGRVRPEIDDRSPQIAFGVALAVGGIVAGCEHLLGVTLPWTALGP